MELVKRLQYTYQTSRSELERKFCFFFLVIGKTISNIGQKINQKTERTHKTDSPKNWPLALQKRKRSTMERSNRASSIQHGEMVQRQNDRHFIKHLNGNVQKEMSRNVTDIPASVAVRSKR